MIKVCDFKMKFSCISPLCTALGRDAWVDSRRPINKVIFLFRLMRFSFQDRNMLPEEESYWHEVEEDNKKKMKVNSERKGRLGRKITEITRKTKSLGVVQGGELTYPKRWKHLPKLHEIFLEDNLKSAEKKENLKLE